MATSGLAPLTVAAGQAQPQPAAVASNAELAATLIAQASHGGARLAVLPELFLCSYDPPTLYREDVEQTHVDSDADGRVADARLDPLRSACVAEGVLAVVGAAVRHPDGRRTISALVVDTDGSVLAAYDKQNLCGPDEKALFVPGSAGATIEVDGWRIGIGICYDGCFPEHARAAAADGAWAYVCPSGYKVGSQHRRDVYYAARALDNSMYVVFANSVGGVEPWVLNGGACIYDPQGQPVARAADSGDAAVVAVLDPDEVSRVRSTHTMLLDRPSSDGGPRRQVRAAPAVV